MEREIREFVAFMHNTKRTSYNTEVSYQRDLRKVSAFLKELSESLLLRRKVSPAIPAEYEEGLIHEQSAL